MAELGTGWISIVPSAKGFSASVRSELNGMEPEFAKAGDKGGQSFSSKFTSKAGAVLKKGGLAVGATAGTAIGAGLTKGIGRLNSIEQAEAKLTGLGNSGKQVGSIMEDSLASVKGTSFGLEEAATTAASVVAAGIKPGQELQGVLTTVGDTATIAGTSMSEMGTIFGSVAARGKLQGDDMLQLLSRGVPVLQLLADETGKTSDEISEMVSKGQIDFGTFERAMKRGMGGAALEAGNTAQGALKNVGAAAGRLGATLAGPFFDQASGAFTGVTSALDDMNDRMGPVMDDFSVWLQGTAIPAVKDFASQTVDSFQSLAQNPAVVSAFDATKLAVEKVVDAGKALAPVAVEMGKSLAQATAAVGVSTWKLAATVLQDVAVVAEHLAGPLQTVADVMADHPALVTAAVAAWTGFKTVPKLLTGVATGIATVTGASKALEGVSNPITKITTALSPIGDKVKLVGGSMQEAAVQTKAFAGQHPEMSKMGVAVTALGNNVPVIGKMGEAYRSASAGLKAYSAEQKIMAATSAGAAERSKDLFSTVDRIGASAFHSASGAVTGFAGTLKGVGAAGIAGFKGAAQGLMTMMGGPWGAALIAGAGAAMFVVDSMKKMDEQQELSAKLAKTGEKAYESMFDTLAKGGDKIESSTEQVSNLKDNLTALGKTDHGGVFRTIDEIGAKYNSLKGYIDPVAKAQAEQTQNQLDTADSAEKAVQAMDDLGLSNEDIAVKLNGSASEFAGFTAKLRESGEGGQALASHLEEIKVANDQAAASFEALGPQAANAAQVIEDLGGKAQTSADDVVTLHDAIYGLGDGAEDAGEAAGNLTEKIDQAANSAKDFGEVALDSTGHIDQTTTAGKEFYDALTDVSDGYVQSVASGNSARDEWLRVKDTFYQLGEGAGFSQGEMDDLLQTMGLMPDQVKTTVDVAGDTAKSELLEIGQQLSSFEGNGPFTATVMVSDQEARDAIENAGFKLSEFDEKTGTAKLSVSDGDAAARFEWWTTHGFPEFDAANPTAKANLDTENLEFSAEYARMQVDTLDMKRPLPIADMDIGLLSDKQIESLNRIGILDGKTPTPKASMNISEFDDNEQVLLAKIFDLSQQEAVPVAKLLGVDDFARDAQATKDHLSNIPDSKNVTVYMSTQYLDDTAKMYGGAENDPSLVRSMERRKRSADGGRIPKSAAGRLIGARGGYKLPTTGPGTNKTDGILGVGADGTPTSWVDAGEWVINAKSAEKYHDLLTAINDDSPSEIQEEASTLTGLAAGGKVGETAAAGALTMGLDLTGGLADADDGGPFSGLMQSWQLMADTMSTTSTEEVSPALAGIQTGIMDLGTGFMSSVSEVMQPAIMGLGQTLTDVKAGVIDPAFAGIQGGLAATRDFFSNSVFGSINPTWQNMGGTVMAVKTGTVDPAFAGIQGGLQNVVNAFGVGATGIGNQWNRVREATAAPVRFAIDSVFNGGIVGMWNSVSDFLGTEKMQPYGYAFASGGHVRGPGGPTEDKIPAMLSDGEYVINAKAVKQIGLSNLNALNDGGVGVAPGVIQDSHDRQAMLNDKTMQQVASRYQAGGIAKGTPAWKALLKGYDWAKSRDGRPYVWGGSADGAGGADCSGFMSGIADVILGGSGARQWATMSFPGTQGGAWAPGLASGFSVGISDVHTAGTIGGVEGIPAVNVESGGSNGGMAFGRSTTVGANDSQFPNKQHLVYTGDGEFVGGSGGGASIGQVVSGMVADAQKKFGAAANGWAASHPGLVNTTPQGVADKLGGAAKAKIDKLTEDMMSFVGGNAESYRGMIKAAYKRQGFQWTQAKEDAWVRQIDSESSGDPRAVQGGYVDANTGGNEAKGLLQIAGDTWVGSRDPGLPDDIFDPWANINAAIRYGEGRYGDGLLDEIGHGHGYDDGGYLPAVGDQVVHNDSGKPEPVFTHEQWQVLRSVVTKAVDVDWDDLATSTENIAVAGEKIAEAAEVFSNGGFAKADEALGSGQMDDALGVLGFSSPSSWPVSKAAEQLQKAASDWDRESAAENSEKYGVTVTDETLDRAEGLVAQMTEAATMLAGATATPKASQTVNIAVDNANSAYAQYRKMTAQAAVAAAGV